MSPDAPQAVANAVPVNIITGALGAGKTTAIAHLLANKPAHESWVVILNEFTDTGIDALTLAAAARGAYDLRMIPGGCLCCTGEEDFRRQMSSLLALPASQRPARILIEPSGIGHPGAMVEELRLFERSGAIRLCSTIALLDAQQHLEGIELDVTAQAQVDAADVVLLAKAEWVTDLQRHRFTTWAAGLYPPKRLVAFSEGGVLPSLALSPPKSRFSFEPVTSSELHQRAHDAHAHGLAVEQREVLLAGTMAQARIQRLLDREACGWMIPAAVLFDTNKLLQLLEEEACWRGVERFKAVLRIDIDHWQLLQRWGQRYAVTDCNWAQDSRIEVQYAPDQSVQWSTWDRRWQSLSEACPVG